MNYCNVNTEKLIKFSILTDRELYNEMYDKFGNVQHAYPIINSQGYYRKYGIRYWLENNFPNAPTHIIERVTFILWCAYNRFNPDEEKFEVAI